MNNRLCDVCGGAFSEQEWEDRHTGHEPGCDHGERTGSCGCDLEYHTGCCPDCECKGQDVVYPQVSVRLVGEDGNAFSILGRVHRALRSAQLSDAEIARFTAEATRGDYDRLLATVAKWVKVS